MEGEDHSTPSLEREEAHENTTGPEIQEREVSMKKAMPFLVTAVIVGLLTALLTWQFTRNEQDALADGKPPSSSSVVESPSGDPSPSATAASANPGDTEPTVGSFNPYPFYSQSCSPNETCVWDVGTMGSLLYQGSPATQVGIVKGVEISWNGQTADAGPSGRCSLVVLAPNSWFENLTTTDVNVTVYNVYTGDNDVAGWVKTLAVQAAQEQSADYGCPMKSYPDDFDIWSSDIESPPCEVIGFECDDANGSADQTTPVDCETLDCKERKATVDFGGELSFKEGDAVAGYAIVLESGEQFTNCYFVSAPSRGSVVDGVVHPWTSEVENLQPC